jgi:hypothetical protein
MVSGLLLSRTILQENGTVKQDDSAHSDRKLELAY